MVKNVLNEPVREFRIFGLFLGPRVGCNRDALKFHHQGLFFHEFSLDLLKISIFDRGNPYVIVVPVSWKREPLCGSSSSFPGMETKKRFVYLIGFPIPFLTVPRGPPG